MLGADVVVVQVSGLLHRIFDDLFCARRLGKLAHGDHVGAALDELLDFEPDLSQVDVEVLEHVGRHAAAFLDQAEQDVLGSDVFVVEPLCLLIGKLHDFSRAVGKSLVHQLSSLEVKELEGSWAASIRLKYSHSRSISNFHCSDCSSRPRCCNWRWA